MILNYDSPDDTLEALDSVMRSAYTDQHVVVVDNNTSGDARAALRSHLPPMVSYLTPGQNIGYAAGNNLGIEYLVERGVDHVCVLNPDARVMFRTIGDLVAAATVHKDAGIVGPRLVHGGSNPATVQSDGGLVDWSRAGATVHVNGGARLDSLKGGVAEVDYVTGACALFSRRMIEDVGTIPEDYFLYYEETDYALRAKKAGWACVVDRDIKALHYRRSTGSVPSRAYVYYMTRNRAVFARRHLTETGAVERAYADLDATFLNPWRDRIGERIPPLTEVFDLVVKIAKEHGERGRTGRYVDLNNYQVEGIAGWES